MQDNRIVPEAIETLLLSKVIAVAIPKMRRLYLMQMP
jgi:hypothetical protein